MPMKTSGERRCTGISAARTTGLGALVEETTTSTSPRTRGSSASPIASPPKRSAIWAAVSTVRFATNVIVAPRDTRFAAASFACVASADEAGCGDRGARRTPGRLARRRRTGLRQGFSPIAISARTRLPTPSALAERPIEDTPSRGRFERASHLSEDLALARKERIEARGDAEQVQHGGVMSSR